jgi:hypothetical protein
MAWKKLGLIFDISKHNVPWLKSHAMLPTPIFLDNNKIRIYFTGRDHNGQSRIGFLDLDSSDPTKIMYIHNKPLLEVGKTGTFDDCGTVGTCVMNAGKNIYLYYNGYNVRNTVPWSNSIGIASSNDGGTTFNKLFEGPIMDRYKDEPYFTISPCILVEDSGWKMWYTSGTGWLKVNNRMEPLYVIKYATSADGINWKRDNITCIDGLTAEESTARSTVVKDGNLLKMWFCYRGSQDFRDGIDSYRIGYAQAKINEPTKWQRDDSKAGISCGTDDFDDKMQAYPSIIEIQNKRFLFYNGNGFGANGFCGAIWE